MTSADLGNISAAAAALHVSQPALSSAISELESRCRFQLINRHPAKGITVTGAGRSFAAEARNLLWHAEEVGRSTAELGTGLGGRLDVGCFVTLAPLFMPRLMKSFTATFPETQLNVVEGTIHELKTFLSDGVCEVAFELPPLSVMVAHRTGTRLTARARAFIEHAARAPLTDEAD